MRRRIVALLAMVVMTVMVVAAPAFAFHHVFIPGGPCGQSANSGGVVGSPQRPTPLPPFGEPAAVKSPVISNTAFEECPAPPNQE
jgi:hypothetical protein